MDISLLLQHIIELKEGQASLRTDVSTIKTDVSEIKSELNEPDGIKRRVSMLEHDRTRVLAWASMAGVITALIVKVIPGLKGMS